jgi:hypothetical protein
MAGRTIPVDEVIAEACTILKKVTEQEKVFMRQWAFTALRKIGFSKINIEISERLYLSDWSALKPNNLVRTIDLALYSSADSEIEHQFKGYANGDLALGENVSGRIHQNIRVTSGYVSITESDNYFNVEEFSDSSPDGVYVIVKYYAVPVDAAGLPKIPEYATLAIIMYIRAMWAMRENTNQSAIEMAWDIWKQERASAEGKGKTPDIIEGDMIAKTINSMIQKVEIHNRQF